MKITLHGASGGEVTGSAYLLQTDQANVLIDCGLFQVAQKLENHNRLPRRGPLQRLGAVVLTHAHLDHSGRLPPASPQDLQIPKCLQAADEAIAAVREIRARWLARQSSRGVASGNTGD